MRSVGLLLRLAWRNVRRRPGQAVLLLVTLTIATGTFGVATSVYGSADEPWDRVWRATDGFHVGLTAYHPPDEPGDAELVADLRRRATALAASAPGVAAVGGPWTHLYGSVDIAGAPEDLTAEVRHSPRSAVDQPLVTDGRWLGAGGGVVVESGLASTLDLGAGDTITIQGRPFPVRGVAMTVSRGRFPLSRPAQVWVTAETGQAMRALGMTEEGFELQIRLDDPADAAAFVEAHRAAVSVDAASPVIAYLETWQQRRADSHSDIDIVAATLFAAGLLLALLTVATAAVLVAGRMAAQVHQIGTLKAVGVTPRQVVAVLLIEHLAIAALASAAGLGLGRVLAPRLAGVSLTVLGRPELPPLTWGRVATVCAVASATVVLGTVRPALRGTRHSTLRSLAAGPRPPRRPGPSSRLVAALGLPLAGALGLRSARRRPARLLTSAAGLTLGVAMTVVAVALHASLDLLEVTPAEPGHAASATATDALYAQVRSIVVATAVLLLVLATVNAFVVAAFAARDTARNHAVLRAVGATPRQTTTALIVSQLGASAIAVALGIPLGLGLWGLMEGGDLPAVTPPAPALVALGAAVPIVFAAIVAVPARLMARRPVAPVLAHE
ncbi:MAG: FtsX-like permease family protein [Acidimicrobiales bacterium]